ncbi:conserved protein of unknown function [Xenorhabdus doucetiae]|uniref:Uncharacterized protein n=1 Tax=Xenorhabdus doucetiae TaxID=351671 RepID=A0A068QT33_9GAMM|nr:conserved protein of unknown function [Xenorhabdus doucetiae]
MFPVSTGINRLFRWKLSVQQSVPREYGDKPLAETLVNGFSDVFPVSTGINRLVCLYEPLP